MTARFTELTNPTYLGSFHLKHSGQMVEVCFTLTYNLFVIKAEDGWEGNAYLHELSERSPELRLLIAKHRILGDAS